MFRRGQRGASPVRTLKSVSLGVLTICVFFSICLYYGIFAVTGYQAAPTVSPGLWQENAQPLSASTSASEARSTAEKHTNSSVPKTKVLLYAYMRGGSSLLGEAFNQNPNASYWFEPLDGLYSHIYGTAHGWVPLDIHYRLSGELRKPPDFEDEAIVDHLGRIFSCDVTSLPQHIVGSYSMYNIVQKRNEKYVACMRNSSGAIQRAMQSDFYDASYKCLTYLSNVCAVKFSSITNDLDACHRNLTTLESDPTSPNISGAFHSYSHCMHISITETRHCCPLLQDICSTSNLIAVKVIRLRSAIIQQVLDNDPEVKVVHLLRDPRGIVHSRQSTKLLSRLSRSSSIEEAKYLCDKMSRDIDILSALASEYPGRVTTVWYEDVVSQPEHFVRDLYDFIGAQLPQKVSGWFEYGMSGVFDTGAYGTMRLNSVVTADMWRQFIKGDQLTVINKMCQKVLKYMDRRKKQ